jgi:hypothetical protein
VVTLAGRSPDGERAREPQVIGPGICRGESKNAGRGGPASSVVAADDERSG